MGEPSHELLPLYRSDSASYRAILACAARHREVSEGSGDGIHSIQFITEALEIVQHRVREPQLRQSDGTVMAIALLASVEVRSSGLFREFGLMMQETWGEDYAARIHWRGLKAIIDERGGLSTLCEEPVLHAALMR